MSKNTTWVKMDQNLSAFVVELFETVPISHTFNLDLVDFAITEKSEELFHELAH